jgi:hypothetical protein
VSRILPRPIDNRYRGHPLGLWLYVPVALQKVAMSLTHLLKSDGGAQSLSSIPLDTYPPSAAQNIVGLFARMGLEQLALALLMVLVLVRYRALIPLMYLLVVAHFLASYVVGALKPLARTGAASVGTPLLVFALLGIVGLGFSLVGKRYAASETD